MTKCNQDDCSSSSACCAFLMLLLFSVLSTTLHQKLLARCLQMSTEDSSQTRHRGSQFRQACKYIAILCIIIPSILYLCVDIPEFMMNTLSTSATLETPSNESTSLINNIITNMNINLSQSNDSINLNPEIKSPLLKILKDKYSNKEYALYCSSGYKPNGIGNALGIYWTARATAFFMNLTFIMNDHINQQKYDNIHTNCNKKEFKLFDLTKPPSKWTWYVPMESHQTFLNTKYPQYPKLTTTAKYDLSRKYNALWQKKAKSGQSYSVPYANPVIFLSFNSFFLPIIKDNYRDSFKRYYDSINSTLYQQTEREVSKYNVLAIHLRLGDTLLVRSSRRILLKMEYFRQALDMVYKNLDQTKSSLCRIYILCQLDESNVHTSKDRMALNIGNKVAHFMVNEIQNYLNNNSWKYELRLIGNNTADNDIFRMSTASYLIGSPSSFSLMSGMGNFMDTKLIILPSKGPWKEISDKLEHATNSDEYRVENWQFIDVAKLSKPCMKFGNFSIDKEYEKFQKWFLS